MGTRSGVAEAAALANTKHERRRQTTWRDGKVDTGIRKNVAAGARLLERVMLVKHKSASAEKESS